MTVAILLISTEANTDYAGIGDTDGLTSNEMLKLAGANVGNFAFKYGIRKMVGEDVIFATYRTDPDYIRKHARALIVAEANLVNPQINYGAPANFIEAVDLPTFCLGIGAQAGNLGDQITIPEGTLRYLRAISRRSPGFGVRGTYTKSIIDGLEVPGARALGCPSFFINGNRDLWQSVIARVKAEDWNRMAVMEGIYAGGHPYAEDVARLERRLFELVRFRGADYIAQAHPSIVNFAMGRGDVVDDKTLANLNKRLAPGMESRAFRELLSARSRVHVRTDHWIDSVRRYQAVVGTRIHGTILALQAERPAAMISHDSRTSELCETLGIPVTPLQEALGTGSLCDFDALFHKIGRAAAVDLDAHRVSLAREILALMTEMGIPASPSFARLCGIEVAA
jgi:hypothetical protein